VAGEAFGLRLVGGIEDVGAVGVGLFGEAVVHGGGGHQTDAGVAVLVFVPVEELAAERARLGDRA
jgi:hypothetical protein